MNIILEAVVGSTAYGLATPDSDIDMLGVYVAPTEKILGLKSVQETIITKNPDKAIHEVGKFIHLAIQCNPTILELLFLEEYTTLTEEGKLLVDNRQAFLSKKIFNAYGGYAISQVRRLNVRAYGDEKVNECIQGCSSSTKSRTAKHARHCFRLLDQGQQLMETRELNVKVTNREELMNLSNLTVNELVDKFETRYAEFKNIKNILPNEPNFEMLNSILLKVRKGN